MPLTDELMKYHRIAHRYSQIRSMLKTLAHLAFAGLHAAIGYNMYTHTDMARELAFYGAYHQNWVNQAIHFVCVPLIMLSAMVWAAYLPLPLPAVAGHRLTWALLMTAMYVVYYIIVDGGVGAFLFSAVLAAAYASIVSRVRSEAAATHKKSDGDVAATKWPLWKLAIVAHVFAWYMQIHPGHAVFEQVKPALLDSLAQSFTTAPLFAFMEGVWALGFDAANHANVKTLVAAQRTLMCSQSGGSYSFC
jgi:uncharacterized membrane protein YGL010W